MDDFDVFTDEINFSKPFYKDLLNKYVKDIPATPIGPNYECKFDNFKLLTFILFLEILSILGSFDLIKLFCLNY